ncbi:MAG: hypothetical protein EAZ97_10995 [Bacteroidetes bacterium]|nr:MAG: hypothetical protein EAZ97_10995 [Bacteroidota bacterium]
MKTVLLIFIYLFFLKQGFAQNNYVMPKDYVIYKNLDNQESRIDADLDKDGIKDLLIVCAKKGSDMGGEIVVLFLSSNYKKDKKPDFFDFEALGYNIELKNNVLIVGACFGNGRFCKTLKFRYETKLQNLQLIGYDEESFGNAVHDGAYNKSVNLLTNAYNLSKYKWNEKLEKDETFFQKTDKIAIPSIIFKDVNQKMESLEQIGAKYLE